MERGTRLTVYLRRSGSRIMVGKIEIDYVLLAGNVHKIKVAHIVLEVQTPLLLQSDCLVCASLAFVYFYRLCVPFLCYNVVLLFHSV